MFQVIVLHEPVIGKLFWDKGHKGRLQDVAEEISIHDAVKDTNLCETMSDNSSSDMNFERILRFWLPLFSYSRCADCAGGKWSTHH